jgi:hypothetical protein
MPFTPLELILPLPPLELILPLPPFRKGGEGGFENCFLSKVKFFSQFFSGDRLKNLPN